MLNGFKLTKPKSAWKNAEGSKSEGGIGCGEDLAKTQQLRWSLAIGETESSGNNTDTHCIYVGDFATDSQPLTYPVDNV